MKHMHVLSPSSCLMFSSDTDSAAGPFLSLLKQQEKAKMGAGMAARQKGDDVLHMIYIKEGNVRPFMKPSEEGREEGGSVVARGWHGHGGNISVH